MIPMGPVPPLHACAAATRRTGAARRPPASGRAPRPGTGVARARGVRRSLAALATLLCYGCTTVQVRTDVPPQAPAVPGRVLLAEPELWLWMEGSGAPDPAESAEALEASQAALAQAFSGRGFAAEAEPDQILVVRSAAVARTAERRRAQVAATVAAIVFFVAVVVVVVVAASKGGSRAPGAAAVPAPPHGLPHPVRPPLRPPLLGPPIWWWGLDLQLHVPVVPYAHAPAPEESPFAAGLAQRGFFDGDAVELTVELQDFRTGEVTLSRTVRGSVDPRDPAAMRALVDRAIGDQPWGRPQTAAPERPISL